MADLATTYTLNCGGGGTIVFNSGTLGNGSKDDLYWLSAVRGLDGPVLRTPTDDVPYGDGSLVHKYWKGGRQPAFEGDLLVQSAWNSSGCQEAFNDMEDALNAALDSIIQTAGTLTWTPTGGAAQSLSVFSFVSLDVQPTNNFRVRSFSFGLISAAADPS